MVRKPTYASRLNWPVFTVFILLSINISLSYFFLYLPTVKEHKTLRGIPKSVFVWYLASLCCLTFNSSAYWPILQRGSLNFITHFSSAQNWDDWHSLGENLKKIGFSKSSSGPAQINEKGIFHWFEPARMCWSQPGSHYFEINFYRMDMWCFNCLMISIVRNGSPNEKKMRGKVHVKLMYVLLCLKICKFFAVICI